jgi:rhodanese-related sulfurtransferase
VSRNDEENIATIFRQLFDSVSGTYSYLLASRAGGEAHIKGGIDAWKKAGGPVVTG